MVLTDSFVVSVMALLVPENSAAEDFSFCRFAKALIEQDVYLKFYRH